MKEERKTKKIVLGFKEILCSVLRAKSKGEGAVFSQLFQPSLAVSWGEESRGNSGKFSGSREMRSRVISGVKNKPKSMFLVPWSAHEFCGHVQFFFMGLGAVVEP